MSIPVISIITVTYNASKVLEQTIGSVIDQSSKNIEYIIIDGKSSDRTTDIIKKYDNKLTYWCSEPDQGLYDAMNKGLKKATGDYIWFLNAGDTIKNKNIATQLIQVAIQNNMPDILYGETDLINSNGVIIGERRLKVPKKLTWRSFRMGMLVSHQAFIVKRTIAPYYDLHYRFSSDFDWCIRCMKDAKTIINCDLVLVNYLYEGLTTVNRKASLQERYLIMSKYYGRFATIIRHIWFAIRFYWAKFFTGRE